MLWQPGTDHAGIATQMVVERQLDGDGNNPVGATWAARNSSKRVWAWKEESGGIIINQLRRLGASCDWSRERFTMDEGLSRGRHQGVRRTPQAGARSTSDKRLVNWDPRFQTAISDLEVEQVEVKGNLWHFDYPVVDSGAETGEFITVATTRPETMLGDTAVAVHPDDERYRHLVGRQREAAARRAADPDHRR